MFLHEGRVKSSLWFYSLTYSCAPRGGAKSAILLFRFWQSECLTFDDSSLQRHVTVYAGLKVRGLGGQLLAQPLSYIDVMREWIRERG